MPYLYVHVSQFDQFPSPVPSPALPSAPIHLLFFTDLTSFIIIIMIHS